jgi:hypothetical protein
MIGGYAVVTCLDRAGSTLSSRAELLSYVHGDAHYEAAYPNQVRYILVTNAFKEWVFSDLLQSGIFESERNPPRLVSCVRAGWVRATSHRTQRFVFARDKHRHAT